MKKSIQILIAFIVITTIIIACSKKDSTPEPTPTPTTYSLTTSSIPTNGGTISPASESFNQGQTVTLTATPATNFVFKNWTGGASGTNNPVTVTMNSNLSVTAVFEELLPEYTNGTGAIGTIGGTISVTDANSPIKGVKVIIPEGALTSEQIIEIKEAPADIKFPGDESQQIVQFLPEGLTFQEPITIEIPYTGNDTTKLGIFYYDPEEDLISQIETSKIDPSNKTISGLTDHFSYYTAWDEMTGMTFNMLKTDDDKIGVRLDVHGYLNNQMGLKYIRTNRLHWIASGEDDVWDVLSDDSYNNVYSLFRVVLSILR